MRLCMQVCGGNAGDLLSWVKHYNNDNEAGK